MATVPDYDAPSPEGGYQRTPPYSLEAEISVLGSMLLSADAIAEVSESVSPADFYRGAHRTMFEAMCDLYDKGEPVDTVTLADELERRGKLADVGGAIAIADISAQVPTPANAVYYARIVTDRALKRRLIEAGSTLTKLGFDLEKSGADAVDEAEAHVFDLANKQRKGEFVPMRDLLSEAFDLIEKLHESDSTITGLETGFTDLDQLTSGLQPGQLIILAARPAMGKSTLVTNMITNVAAGQRKPAAIFSLEMGQMEIVQRMLSAEAKLDSDRLRTGKLRHDDWPKLSKAMGKLSEAPLFIDDTPGITMMEIRSKCRRIAQRHGLSLIVVDYLQLMESHKKSDGRVQEVAEFSRGLKVLAKEIGCPVIALSQLSRKPEERTDRRPMLSDLRESGAIEQDADIVGFIYRDEVYNPDTEAKGEAELIIAKHRAGRLATVRLSFLGHHSRFANIARTPGPPPGSGGGGGGYAPPPAAPAYPSTGGAI
ncbi:Replicative DNA helicase [Euzebya pacifica]|uniref:Replicative DNA helicase n=1 Tax=Euzebya pacifica TaxID=1608957 RepID=A0A346Y539_9ACTN|nr:replicative DNA helicase [Euzebya pacifica]AXV09586.1 Replicative DNA helicase [Euzebya pacifica]